MRHPTKADFDVEVREGGVEVTFRPTNSIMTYDYLTEPEDIARFGPVFPASIRHAGATGDFDNYVPREVEIMALEVAEDAVPVAAK